MIYRIGKYTPYKGPDQEIEMMLKLVNNDEQQKAKVSFSIIEEENPQGADNEAAEPGEGKPEDDSKNNCEITKEDKISKMQSLNADIDLPAG